MDQQAFQTWMTKVDAAIAALCGLSHSDLADQCYADMFLDGVDPQEAAEVALEDEGFPF